MRLATSNALATAKSLLSGGEKLNQMLTFTIYVAAEDNFQSHTKLADSPSNYLFEQLGDSGKGSRAAIGVASLPDNAPVEIQLTAAV